MGLFGGIDNAKYTDGGVYLTAGIFRLKIKALKTLRTRTGKDAFVAEFETVESTSTKHIPGSDVSWMVTFDKDSALGNIRQFLSATVNKTIEAITEAVAQACLTAVDANNVVTSNPLSGFFVRAQAFDIKTRAGKDFTKVKYSTDAAGAPTAA